MLYYLKNRVVSPQKNHVMSARFLICVTGFQSFDRARVVGFWSQVRRPMWPIFRQRRSEREMSGFSAMVRLCSSINLTIPMRI